MLYICATPIGNLKDITLRVLEVLETVDEIACEDTRTSGKLLNYYNIKKPLLSYHEHNERARTEIIIEKLKQGRDIALISDAGMPGISDPGEILIKACIANQLEYTVLPGCSAAITALVASNLVTQPFYYHGFLARKQMAKQLEKLKHLTTTMVFYESPHRLSKTLQLMFSVFGNRQLTLARELTKIHEQYQHFDIATAIDYYSTNKPKGEFVIVVEGANKAAAVLSLAEVVDIAKKRIAAGERHKDVVKEIAKQYNVDRQTLYKETLLDNRETE